MATQEINEYFEQVGNILRVQRIEAGLSVQQLVIRILTHGDLGNSKMNSLVVQIYNFENGKHMIPYRIFKVICIELDFKPSKEMAALIAKGLRRRWLASDKNFSLDTGD